MQEYNSYDLFVRNPLAHTNFPFLAMDCNNRINIPPRQRFQEMHWHDDIQITYVLEGKIKIIALDQSIVVGKGEGVFINKHVLHQFVEMESSHYRSYVFPDVFIKFYDQSPMSKDIESISEKQHIGICLLNKSDETIDIIKNLDEAVFGSNRPPNKEYYISMLLVRFMYAFIHSQTNKDSYDVVASDYHLSFQKCLAFIHRHYGEEISLDTIASYGNISVGHCGRLFLQILETTPYEYLINYRIKKSLELLSQNNKTISQIALEVGFNDVSHFIQSFKKRMKVTPKQYQKQLFRVGRSNDLTNI